MRGMEVILPGGLPKNGDIERQVRFQPLTGTIEQALLDFACEFDRPRYVTAVLGTVLDTIGGYPADTECAASLCVADRQYLMLRLAAMLDGEQMWLEVGCAHCEAKFDVDVRRCDLPVKEAGQGYPLVTLRVKENSVDVRVPTGVMQERIGPLSEDKAMQQLLQSCICAVNDKPAENNFINNLTEDEIEVIDDALEEASPEVCNQLLVTCPECRREQYAELDHYCLAFINEHAFYEEVHTLASHYHWSEEAILGLPITKRRRYLGLINRSAGMSE